MTLQFILGKASSDHRQPMIDLMAQRLIETPNAQQFFLIPNHIKFESEVDVLNRLHQIEAPDDRLYAQSAVQVLSFTRLAWFFLNNTAYYQRPRISQAGMNMLLYQLLLDLEPQLQVFNGVIDQPGFISQLSRQLADLELGRITPSDLMAVADQLTDGSGDLAAKLHDLNLLYVAFEEQMTGKYIENSDLLAHLAESMTENPALSQMHFYVDGYNDFTAQETALLQTMMAHGASLTVALTLDHRPTQVSANDLFYNPGNTYQRLLNAAHEMNVPVKTDLMAATQRSSDDLKALEDYWIQSTKGDTSSQKGQPLQQVSVVAADSRYAEIDAVTTKIRQMVATEGYRYSDFLVLGRHLDAYETVLQPVFNQQQIPYFADVTQSMSDHPFVAFLQGLFDVARRHYRYDDMMKLLKTGLLRPMAEDGTLMPLDAFRHDLSLTENLILKNGIEGEYRWVSETDWQFVRIQEGDDALITSKNQAINDRINHLKHFVADTLPVLYQKMSKATDVTAAVTVLYDFLETHGVITELSRWRDEAIAAGDLVKAGQPEQTWSTFAEMLDEFVTILGDRPYHPEHFAALVMAGFEGASYAQIPSTLDQVLVSETGIVQSQNRKVTFMIGATDDVMPDHQVQEHLLTDADSQQILDGLGEAGQTTRYLAANSADQLAGEPFVNYLGFLSGTEQLIFSYPMAVDGNEATTISPYVSRLVDHFELPVRHFSATPAAIEPKLGQYLGSSASLTGRLIQIARESQLTKQPLARPWLYMYRELVKDENERPRIERLFQSLNYRNVPTPLDAERVAGLYGTTINTSISKLEEFYQNPYSYFLKYGLKLQERDVFELNAASTGEFFHAALDQFMKLLNTQHLSLANLDEQQRIEMVNEVTAKLLEPSDHPEFEILQSSARMGYIKDRLIETIHKMLTISHLQQQRTPARPHQTEMMFGQIGADKGLKSLDFDLGDDRQVRVRGKIDRIDSLVVDNTTYLNVVDYKSSEHKFNYADAFHGTALQLMTYLDAVRQNIAEIAGTTQAKIGGALYLHLTNPLLKPGEITDGELEEALLKSDKYQGLLINNDDFLHQLDQSLTDGVGKSSVYPLGFKKDGGLSKSQAIMTEEDLIRFLDHTEMLIRQAGQRIFAGNLDLAPVKWSSGRTALTYTSYAGIMQFDPMLPENQYTDLVNFKPDDVLQKLREARGEAD